MKRSEPSTGVPAAASTGLAEEVREPVVRETARRERREKFLLFVRNGQGMLGLVLVLAFFGSAIFAPWIAPYDPNRMDIPARLASPSRDHIAGTDQLGRDTLSRVLFSGRVALKVAAIGVSVSLFAGLMLGMLGGYGARWLDNSMLLAFDTVRAFPTIVLALATVAVTGPSLEMVLAIIIVTLTPQYGRMARTSTLAIRNTEFIAAERSLGASTPRILLRHVMPNVIIVSHNLGLIAELCDEVIVMYAGEIVERGDARQIFYRAQHPYTRALLECDPARVLERTRHLPVIPGDLPDLASPPPACAFAPRCARAMDVCGQSKPRDEEKSRGHVARCHLLSGEHRDPDWPPPGEVITVYRGGAPRADAGAPAGWLEASRSTAMPVPDTGAPLLEVSGLRVRFRVAGALRAFLHRHGVGGCTRRTSPSMLSGKRQRRQDACRVAGWSPGGGWQCR